MCHAALFDGSRHLQQRRDCIGQHSRFQLRSDTDDDHVLRLRQRVRPHLHEAVVRGSESPTAKSFRVKNSVRILDAVLAIPALTRPGGARIGESKGVNPVREPPPQRGAAASMVRYRGFDWQICVLKSPSRPRGIVYPSAAPRRSPSVRPVIAAARVAGWRAFEQTSSNPNVFLNRSAHGMYFELLGGLLCSAGTGSAGAGTTSLRAAACDERTTK